jgi:hypothetical protein
MAKLLEELPMNVAQVPEHSFVGTTPHAVSQKVTLCFVTKDGTSVEFQISYSDALLLKDDIERKIRIDPGP